MHNIKQNLGRVVFLDDLHVASWYWLLLKVILDFPPIYGYEKTIVDGIYHGFKKPETSMYKDFVGEVLKHYFTYNDGAIEVLNEALVMTSQL